MQRKLYTPAALLLLSCLTLPVTASAEETDQSKTSDGYTAVLPTVVVESMAEEDVTKGYVSYEEASVTRNNLTIKETPMTIDTLNIQKNKNYGTSELSAILEGNAGIDSTYDMRSDNIYIRGFRADINDIYRDGVRESGQTHRSTANIERIEILKGPASVLYGRSGGGGVINMVSKFANFSSKSSVGGFYGSWDNRGIDLDVNEVINDNVAVRLVGEATEAQSFRAYIDSDSQMLSPSITVKTDGGLLWTMQYTYDHIDRVPDRGPNKDQYDLMGISYKKSFAVDGDWVEDELHTLRSSMEYSFSNAWDIKWDAAWRKASQNFDHYYLGTYNTTTKLLSRSYAWQDTDYITLSNTITVNGDFQTGAIEHHTSFGFDLSHEERNPTVYYDRGHLFDPYDRSSWTRIAKPAAVKFDNEHNGDSYGLFAQDLISIFPTVKVLLGGRFDFYKFETTDMRDTTASYDGNNFSPNAGIVWDASEAHTLYASWAKSFSPYGGKSYLGVSTSADESTYNDDPEYNEQYEVGIKSDWMQKRLSTTLSLYQLEHKNIRYRPDDSDLTYWAVRGEERSRGVELSAIGQLYEDWYLRGSLGVKSAEVTEDKENPDNEGHHLDDVADVNSSIFIRYAPVQSFYGEVGAIHVGKRYYYDYDGTSHNLDQYTTFDAMIGYNYDPFNVTLAVSNIFDKEYWRSSAMPGTPRAVTLRLNYNF